MTTRYVLGFVFNYEHQVLLMNKLKPAFQVGRYNGIGGKVEENECYEEAMVRESKEELITPRPLNWIKVGKFWSLEWIVFTFCSYTSYEIKAGEEEPVKWFDCDKLPPNRMYNLDWLIPLAKFQGLYHANGSGLQFAIDESKVLDQISRDQQDRSDRLDRVSR